MPNVIRRVLCKLLHLYFETNAKCKRSKGVVLMLHDVGGNGGEFDVSDEAFSELLEKLGRKNLVRLENWKKEDELMMSRKHFIKMHIHCLCLMGIHLQYLSRSRC